MPVDPTTTPIAGDPDSWPEQSYLPSDATKSFSSRYNTPIEAVYDRTAWQRARLLDPILVPLFQGFPADGRFVVGQSFDRWGWEQAAVDEAGILLWHVQINPKVRVTQIVASLDGDDGGGSNPGFPAPADRPFFRAYRQPTDGTAWTLLATATDESASKAEYEAHHEIVMDPGAIPDIWPAEFAEGEYLVLELYGHKGPNVGASTLKVYGLQIDLELIPS
jgi:hypothetical protein